MAILVIIYVVLGYWSCGKTIYANTIRFGNDYEKMLQTKVEGLIVRCKDETDYLNLRDKILGSSEAEDIKIEMLRLCKLFIYI